MTIDKKLSRLYSLLENAEKLAREFSGGYSNHFIDAEDFHKSLSESIIKLKSGNWDEIDRLWVWFAPTCDWDDLIGRDGEVLANEVFLLLSDLKPRHL